MKREDERPRDSGFGHRASRDREDEKRYGRVENEVREMEEPRLPAREHPIERVAEVRERPIERALGLLRRQRAAERAERAAKAPQRLVLANEAVIVEDKTG